MSIHLLAEAAEYRRRAETHREVAHLLVSQDARIQLLEAAQHLEALAEEAERRAREANAGSDPKMDA